MARTFRFDPVVMLEDADPFHWLVRVAAHAVIAQDEREQAERAKAATGKSRVAGRRGR